MSSLPPNEAGEAPEKKNKWRAFSIPILLLVIASAIFLPRFLSNDSRDEINFNEFIQKVENKEVKKAEINNSNGSINAELIDGTKIKTNGRIRQTEKNSELIDENVDEVKFFTPRSNFWLGFIQIILPIALLILFFWWLQRRAKGQLGGIMSIGRSRAKTYSTERPNTSFDDVAGYKGVKKDVEEIVDFLSKPDKFATIGARIPKGVLLVGPPGTGKTLLARAVAGEAGVTFSSVTGSDFMEMFVGVGASRVRDLFQNARKTGKAIIFIDEIDSIGRKRGAGLGGGHDEREQTLNQLLSELDGFETTEGIVVLAATNRPDILDSALLRPGRFDRQVIVPLPELSDRKEILKVHIKGKSTGDDIDIDVIARGTPGMSGADLANLVNEAALFAVRDNNSEIHMNHFEQARDRILIGQKRESLALSEIERKTVAYHEAGHAICAAVLENTDPLHKVTIIPSGMALGVTLSLPIEERHIYRKNYIEDTLVLSLGGRVAEEIVFDMISTGANDDLVRVTELATKMVREWGMSEKVGPMAWGSNKNVFLGDELMAAKEYSDDTARVIDLEVEEILQNQLKRCRTLLKKHRKALDAVANALLEQETIQGEEVERLITESKGNGATPKSEKAKTTNLEAGKNNKEKDSEK